MSTPRIVRVNELPKREIAEDLHRHFSMTNFDTAAVTVTRVQCTTDLRDADVFVSIFGHEGERDRMISYINRNRQAIVKMMIKRVKLKYTPRLHFILDETIEQGDNILSIIAEMERKEQETTNDTEEN